MHSDKVRITLKSGTFKRQDQFVERLLEEGFSSTDIASALLHHLQGGDGAAAAQASPAEERPKADRPKPRESHQERFDKRAFPSSRQREEQAGRPSSSGAHHARSARSTLQTTPGRPQEGAVRPIPHGALREPSGTGNAIPRTSPSLPSVPSRVKPLSGTPHLRSAKSNTLLPKASRRTPDEQTRLFMNVGAEMAVVTADVVEAILGQTGLPAKTVGTVDIRERHLFVDVAAEHANSIISKLNRTQIKGHKLKVKTA